MLTLAPSFAAGYSPDEGGASAPAPDDGARPHIYTIELKGPHGEPIVLEVDHPPLSTRGERNTTTLAYPAHVARKMDDALLDLEGAAARGVLRADGTLPIIVRTSLATLPLVSELATLPRLGLAFGTIDLRDLPALALLPGVERIHLDDVAKTTLAQSVPLIRADDVHNQTDGIGRAVIGTGVTIAIIDTGIDHTHPDLGGCWGPGCKVAGGYDFVNDVEQHGDDMGHGTHVAATAAGTYGVAPNATLLSYKVCNAWGSCQFSHIIFAIENATNAGADIISMSLGGGGSTDGPMATTVDWAVEQGVVVVSAAGNNWDYDTVGEPAAALRGIAVGATTKSDQIAYFSSRGPVRDSQGIVRGMKPDVTAPGVGIVAAVPDGDCILCSPTGYLSLSGTSMATPHVSGAAALLLQAHPGWTPDDVKAALMSTALRGGYDSRTEGEGRIDAYAAWNASLVATPANGWLGLDLVTNATFERSVPVTVRNLGSSTQTFGANVSTQMKSPSFFVVDADLNAPEPRLNVTEGGPVLVGPSKWFRLENIPITPNRTAGSLVALYAPGGLDPIATMTTYEESNTTIRVQFYGIDVLAAGDWRLEGADGLQVLFGVGSGPTTTVSPGGATLAPGEAATLTLNLSVDNAWAPIGWHEMELDLSGSDPDKTRFTFATNGVLHVDLNSTVVSLDVYREGKLIVSDWFPSLQKDIYAPPGDYDLLVSYTQCGLSDCGESAFAIAFEENVVHEGESWINLTRFDITNKLRHVARIEDGTVVNNAPGCATPRQPGPCVGSNWLWVYHEAFSTVHGYGQWAGAPYWLENASADWNVGSIISYGNGDDTYFSANATRGITGNVQLETNVASFVENEVRYGLPDGLPAGRGAHCFGWLGGGASYGDVPASGTERFLVARPQHPDIIGQYGFPVDPVPCDRMVEQLVSGSYFGEGCGEHPLGCSFIGESSVQLVDDGVLSIVPNYGYDVVDPYQDAAVVFDGAPTFQARVQTLDDAVFISSLEYGRDYWMHGSGGHPYLYTFGTPHDARMNLSVKLDGQTLRSGEPGWYSTYVPLGGGEGTVEIASDFGGGIVDGKLARAEWAYSYSSALNATTRPSIGYAHAIAAGEWSTRFLPTQDVSLALYPYLRDASAGNLTGLVTKLIGPNGTWTDVRAVEPGPLTIPVGTLAPGQYDLELTLETSTGEIATLHQRPAFYVVAGNNTPPTASFTSPAPGSVVRGKVHVNGTASDADGNVTKVEVSTDGGATWKLANGTTSWTFLFDTAGHAGNVTLLARSWDGIQASPHASLTLVVDPNDAPKVTITSPAPFQVVNTTFLARGTTSDPDGAADVAFVDVRIDGGAWARANGTTNWSIALATSSLAPGLHTLRARALDQMGAEAFANVTFEVLALPDLVVLSLEVERVPIETSYATLPNDVAERRIVRATIANVGQGPSGSTSVNASASATLHAPGTTASYATSEALGPRALPPLAPGRNATLEWVWDTLGNVGDHDILVRADPLERVNETREDNNEKRERSWVVVGGLGGVALLAPVNASTPYPAPMPGVDTSIVGNVANQTANTIGNVLRTPFFVTPFVDIAYDVVCGADANDTRYNTVQCRQLTGRQGMPGALDLCGPNPPPNNLVGSLLWAAWNSADDTTRATLVGGSTCRHAFDDLYALAARADGVVLLP